MDLQSHYLCSTEFLVRLVIQSGVPATQVILVLKILHGCVVEKFAQLVIKLA